MAETSPPRKLSRLEERQRLLREIETSRRQLAVDLSGLGQAVNVRQHFRDAVSSHPAWWIAGGLVVGLALAKIAVPSRRTKRGTVEAGMATAAKRSLFLGLLGFAGKQILRLSEPALTRLAQQELERWSQSRFPAAHSEPTRAPRPQPASPPDR